MTSSTHRLSSLGTEIVREGAYSGHDPHLSSHRLSILKSSLPRMLKVCWRAP